ncbi:hypothetical protein DFH08DRAFT_987452 [Mycena albidolilacea]|uniref:Uncharacterized protein n=1 Tax=Mycena albidolilacea TaxID=1033008 RepID=A0AAD7AAB4_9AGAR|nr:hypothetical protein DFH08DRAFT_987452 [Mycena albidolilacea]
MAGDETLQKDHEDSGSEDEEEDVVPKVEIDPSTLTPLSPEVISKKLLSTWVLSSLEIALASLTINFHSTLSTTASIHC